MSAVLVLLHSGGAHHTDVVEITELLVVVETVADNELKTAFEIMRQASEP